MVSDFHECLLPDGHTSSRALTPRFSQMAATAFLTISSVSPLTRTKPGKQRIFIVCGRMLMPGERKTWREGEQEDKRREEGEDESRGEDEKMMEKVEREKE